MKDITVWQRLNRDSGKWEHNHISDGYDDSETEPTPNCKLQERSWARSEWRKCKAQLDEGCVVVHPQGVV